MEKEQNSKTEEKNNNEIKRILEESNIKYKYCKDISLETANKLSEGKLVAWFQGRSEWGPRALGSRSILADPTRKEMKNIINKVFLTSIFISFIFVHHII